MCLRKLDNVANILEINGKLYLNFEEALPFYKKEGILKEVKLEFNNIINFIYLDRKEDTKRISKYKEPYIISRP